MDKMLHTYMKKISGSRILQYLTLVYIIALVTSHYAHEWYGPISDQKLGFPLQLVWKTKLKDNIKEVHITENGKILVLHGYSVNLISPTSGDLIWKFRTDKPMYTATSGNDKVYVFGDSSFFILNETDGEPLLEDYHFYSANFPIDSYTYKNQIITSGYGDITLIDAESGELLFNYNIGRGEIGSCPYSNFLYSFSSEINVLSLNSEELILNDKTFGYTKHKVCDGKIAYFISRDSRLVAYDLELRTQLWLKKFLSKEPSTLEGLFIAGDFLVAEEIDDIFIISKKDGSLIQTLSLNNNLTEGYLISSATITGNNLYLFEGFSQSIYSYDITTWQQTGILHLSFPVIFATETERFINIDNLFILWKNKYIYAYQ